MKAPRSFVLVIAGLFVLSACSTSLSESVDTTTTTRAPVVDTTAPPAAPTIDVSPGYEAITTADGRTRTFRVVDLSEGEPAALLFVLHGFSGTAEGMRQYVDLEDRLAALVDGGVIVVYPNGSGAEQGLPQSWNAGGCCPFATFDMVDDVAFFNQMLDVLEATYEIDDRRIWAVGHSNGGMMAYRLACELSSRFTAIGVAAGAMMVDSCAPTEPVSVLHLHGELDNVVPVSGGGTAGITFPSARDSFSRFAVADGCAVDETTATCSAGVEAVLRIDSTWTHDWQMAWNDAFVEFFASRSSN